MKMTIKEAFSKAVEAHKAGHFQKASEIYEVILKAEPKNPDVNHNLGVIALALGHTSKAEPLLRLALEVNPNVSQYWQSYMSALISLDKVSEAQSLLVEAREKGIGTDTIDIMKNKLAGVKHVKNDIVNNRNPSQKDLGPVINSYTQGKLEETVSHANDLINKFPNSEVLYNMLGIAKRALGQHLDSIDCFKKAIEIKPDFSEAYNGLGNVLREMGKPDAAIDSFQKALEIKKNYPEAYYNMSIVLHEKGSLKDAVKNFKAALKLKKNYPEAYNGLGNTLKEMGDLEAAVEAFKEAIKIKDDFAEAHFNLGNLLHESSQFDAAIKSYKQAIKYKENFQQAYLNMGNVLRITENYREARETFLHLRGKEPVAQVLECDYILGEYDTFDKRLRKISKTDQCNLRVAAISAFAADQRNIPDIYPFCKEPINYIKFGHLKTHLPKYEVFIKSIIDEMNENDLSWEPKNYTTKGGFRTTPDLFSNASQNLKLLQDILQDELHAFQEEFKNTGIGTIKNWPKKIKLSAWYVRLLKKGYQTAHIHSNGWVSGVLYLKTIRSPIENEGAIEFGLQGYDYPVLSDNYPRRIHQPEDGDIVLFPSSLFHQTVPVKQNVERCVIAFDLVGDK